MEIKKSNRGGKREGSGRPKGRPNKTTAEIKRIAQQYGENAVRMLADLMETSESDQARIAAAKELLDRGYGKSTQPIAGDPENPLGVAVTHRIEFVSSGNR